MGFNGTINKAGRPKGATNRLTTELKIVLEKLAQDIHQSIDINKLKDAEKLKLFVSILPYLMPKKQEIEVQNSNDISWIDSFSEEQLSKLLNNQMAHLGGQIYTTIKESIKMSTEPFGLIATYQDATGKLFYFISGRPVMSIASPKKEV